MSHRAANPYPLVFLFVLVAPLLAQSNTGELRLKVIGPNGTPEKSSVVIISEANHSRQSLLTDDAGILEIKRLTFGLYHLEVHHAGFAPFASPVEIRFAVPTIKLVSLGLAPVETTVDVRESGTLVDPQRVGNINQIGTETIEHRLTALPGRSMQDLLNSEPGWLYEGNAVLHPRGSEYQTQFVVDGIPLTDNRSPSFGPAPADADDVESLEIYTAGFPAEYGRKMGGVVEINTLKNSYPGFHGQLALFGGAYATAAIHAQGQFTWKGNTLGVSGSGNTTGHYLNPVVPENYTNNGTTGSFSTNYERELTEKDRLTLIVGHELARYEIPNELVQQNGAYLPNSNNNVGCPAIPPADEPSNCVFIPGGQLQTGDNFETMGSASYQHIFSADTIGWVRFMARENSTDFYSNPASWPLLATQHNNFKENYFNGSVAIHHGKNEWKMGVESDAIFLHESTGYVMVDCADLSDPQCPIALGFFDTGATTFAFTGTRPDLEQSAYIQDSLRLGNWTVNAGLRWDHYQLLVNQNAESPRISMSRYFPTLGLNLHGSYDRIFQTPSFENILLSSSPAAETLDASVPAVQLPVQPSHGNYYELGLTKALFNRVKVDANMFGRKVNNYADDSQLLSTGISFPIAFRDAILYGAEGKLEVQNWRGFSGIASYSYIVGNVFNPVTGGLFLGDNASAALTQTAGHSPDSQDQRQTIRARVQYQVTPGLWIALGSDYNSGLPFQADLTPEQYATEYGQTVISHLNFDRGRIRPYLTENASVGADLHTGDKYSVRLQIDAQNLSNTLEVIDFGGLFSGNAIGPSRSLSLRLTSHF
jgi:hypothetical protein